VTSEHLRGTVGRVLSLMRLSKMAGPFRTLDFGGAFEDGVDLLQRGGQLRRSPTTALTCGLVCR
jgi:hypothetical protein